MTDIELNKVYNEDCRDTMARMSDNFIDLTVTSPPYDKLRMYTGELQWNDDVWREIIKELYRVTNKGGVVVWVVTDSTIKCSKTGTSFKQALWAMGCGFNLHDHMIWNKNSFSAVGALKTRYAPVFENMFIWTKGKIKTFNPIKDKQNKHAGVIPTGTLQKADGTMRHRSPSKPVPLFSQRNNIWELHPLRNKENHPAPFPEPLANDHIISWSNENDIVYDPMAGSGTTPKMTKLNNRNWIASEISPEYCDIIRERVYGEE